MRHPVRLLAISMVATVLAGCFGGGTSPSASGSAGSVAASASTPATGSVQPSSSVAASPSVEPIPSEALEPFTCELPIHVNATLAIANITDVRVGTHADYDRVVFEFTGGIPEASLERAEPPFTHDASGAPIDVEGTSFLRLILRGGSKQTDSGTSSYDGPLDFDPGFATLVDLIEGGDFERQSTWYFGLTSEACVRVMTLDGEGGSSRLVIDVEH
jgi:hypothetical protein